MPKDFVLVEFLKGVFNLGKMSKEGEGFGAYHNFWSTFCGFLWLTKSAVKKNSVHRPNSILEANNMKVYAVLLHFAKCRDLHV